MPYRITEVKSVSFPNDDAVRSALDSAGLPQDVIHDTIRDFICAAPLVSGFGYQQSIARHLESHLGSELPRRSSVQPVSTRISPELNEAADLAFARAESSMAVYIEIEFRPNVEKDLVKFQIAYNRGRLSAAVLLLAIDRSRINPDYTTMPEFAKTVRLVAQLMPPYPLLVIGIAGHHEAETSLTRGLTEG